MAECSRRMRISEDWVVPVFMKMPHIRKPPLPYWLIAAGSYLFPHDPVTGQPVTTMAT